MSEIVKVVFDWNGTLLADTMAIFRVVTNIIMNEGGQPPTFKQFLKTASPNASKFFAQYVENAVGARDKFLHYYEPEAAHCRTRRGTRHVLRWLKHNGIPAMILSNHTQHGIENQLRRLGLRDMFGAVLSQASPGGNKQERLENYLTDKAPRLSPANILIVGDTPEEAEIGHKLGIVSAIVRDGCHAFERVRAAKPTHIISAISHLVPIIQKRGN